VGALVEISTPRNSFELAEPVEADTTAHTVLLGAGIGITPLLAMAETLAERGRSFELHCYATSEATLPLREYLTERPFVGRTTLHFSANGDSARSAANILGDFDASTTTVHACGPEGFLDRVLGDAARNDWPPDRVRVERFRRSTALTSTSDGAFVVHARSTGEDYVVEAEETIAEVLDRHGVETFLSCEQGMCGACLTTVLSGVPDHRDEILSQAEKARNDQVTICCSRSLTSSLTLDI
jgi:vanillate O-demethylase ferredoxin subunit